MFVQQAIFTSVRSGRNEGYQLAAVSPDVTSADARELAQWGPAHDSLYDTRSTAVSVNFHQLKSGLFCISQTVLAGREYSGRGGQRVYTHFFLLPLEVMNRFANHPFRVVEALVVAGRANVFTKMPERLDAIPLVGRASPVRPTDLECLCQMIRPEKLAALLNAALKTPSLGVTAAISPRRLFSGLIDLIPLPLRLQYTLTTGLKVSPRRPYRLAILPDIQEEQRQAIRVAHLTHLDLITDPPPKYAAKSGWPLLMYDLLRRRQFSKVAAVALATAQSTETDTNLLAEEMREFLHEPSETAALIKPFAP